MGSGRGVGSCRWCWDARWGPGAPKALGGARKGWGAVARDLHEAKRRPTDAIAPLQGRDCEDLPLPRLEEETVRLAPPQRQRHLHAEVRVRVRVWVWVRVRV